mgnify:FL=1
MVFIVNKYLYIRHEQQPLHKIFNEKINQVSRTKTTGQSQRTYPKNNGGT